MPTKPQLLDHARTAVERTARSLAELRARLDAPAAATLGRRHRLLIDGALHDLGCRHDRLAGLYEAMLQAPEEQVAACWQRFFACYDDYLDAARDARSRLVQDEDGPALPRAGGGRAGHDGHA